MSKKAKIEHHINNQCIDFGITLNWNHRPGIELSFFIWRIYIEIDWKIPSFLKKLKTYEK